MQKLRILILCPLSAILLSCGNTVEEKVFRGLKDEAIPAKTISIDGWDIAVMNDGANIFIDRDGEGIVAVEQSDEQRTVRVWSRSGSIYGAAELIDYGLDTDYEAILYANPEIWINDIGLDGVIENKMIVSEKTLYVLYKGEYYPLVDEGGGNRYIVVDGSKIPTIYDKYGTFIAE